jgi:hypothetical protein
VVVQPDGVVAVGLALELVSDAHRPGVQIHVRPPQTERLALAEPHGDGHGVQRRQSMALHDGQELAGVIRCERLDLVALVLGQVDELGHVPRHESPPLRLRQGATQRRMDQDHAARRQP